jgi:NAD(P)H-dependent flavin oxidoreductase YrpB (nitropropane dioxygenase family)
MKTAICDALGIEFPILAFTHCRDVVAAVSKAGGLGVLGIAGHSLDTIDVELDWIESELGDKPYGVDVLIPAKTADTGAAANIQDLLPQEHRDFVAALLDKYGVPPLPDDAVDPRAGRPTGRGQDMKGHAVHLIELAVSRPQIKLAASALGPPPPSMVDLAHQHDTLVAALVGRREHAERQKAAGVDIIVAQGYEAGGHVGEIGTMVLIPEIVDAVAPLPVIAAGGIASGRQIAAALALGAQGVWTGSVWLTTAEAETHPVVKEKFLHATSSDTVRSRASTGKPARQLRSAWTDEWEDPANPDPLGMPLHGVLIGEAQQRIRRSAYTPGSGAEKLINYFVGQVVGSLNEVKPAGRVLMEMVEEYIDVAEHFAKNLADMKS